MLYGSKPNILSGIGTVCIGGFGITRRGRFWVVTDPQDVLVCVTVYKVGALEVVRRLVPPDLRPLVAAPQPRRLSPSPKPRLRRYDMQQR
jgi:hypothetical protein